jgi:pilus assembly protein CpaF
MQRLADGTRKVVTVSEVQGMEGDIIVLQDVFQYMQTGVQNARVQGYFTAKGIRPKFMEQIEASGISVPPTVFAPARKPGKP